MIMFIDFVKEILSQVNLEEAISMFIFDKYIIILIIVYMYVFVINILKMHYDSKNKGIKLKI